MHSHCSILQELADDDGGMSYTILLILTAGHVENVRETRQALIEASEDPLSIVVVGIGDADFSEMHFLDERRDYEELGGRHITKFIQFRDYKSFNALTEAVLEEIPNQLVTYFFDRGIMPGQADDPEAAK
jgi:copine 4/6/7